MNVPGIVYVIWWILLLAAIFVVLPITVFLLQRTLNASRNIERYLAEMLEAGVGIANNTANIKALEDTIGVATQMLDTAGNLQDHSATIATVLGERANGRGR
ncbi:MAG: hypothetical protein ACE5LU_13575 [Anaerolineae bacterium]